MCDKKIVKNYWICIVGDTDKNKLKGGADNLMCNAVDKAFKKTTGHDYNIMWSGWGSTQERVDIINAIWNMEKDDPIFISIVAMLKGSKRLI